MKIEEVSPVSGVRVETDEDEFLTRMCAGQFE